MERYRILPHTADGKFRAFGATREEAFANAALAAASLMWDWWTEFFSSGAFRRLDPGELGVKPPPGINMERDLDQNGNAFMMIMSSFIPALQGSLKHEEVPYSCSQKPGIFILHKPDIIPLR